MLGFSRRAPRDIVQFVYKHLVLKNEALALVSRVLSSLRREELVSSPL